MKLNLIIFITKQTFPCTRRRKQTNYYHKRFILSILRHHIFLVKLPITRIISLHNDLEPRFTRMYTAVWHQVFIYVVYIYFHSIHLCWRYKLIRCIDHNYQFVIYPAMYWQRLWPTLQTVATTTVLSQDWNYCNPMETLEQATSVVWSRNSLKLETPKTKQVFQRTWIMISLCFSARVYIWLLWLISSTMVRVPQLIWAPRECLMKQFHPIVRW